MAITDAPPGFAPLKNDVPWRPGYLELVPPERVFMLGEFGPDAAGPTALSPVAITTPFRFLSDEGIRVMHALCSELEGFAGANNRIANARAAAFTAQPFCVACRPTRTCSNSSAASSRHRSSRTRSATMPCTSTMRPTSLARTSTSGTAMSSRSTTSSWSRTRDRSKGGRFEYFLGPVEEGRDLLLGGAGLPPERVVSLEFPGQGWAILQQGHRVLHRATRLEERGERITAVASFYMPDPKIPDPADLPTLRAADGNDIALVEWSGTHPWSPRGGCSTLPKRARPSRARGKSSKRRCGRASLSSRMRSRSSTGMIRER